MKQFVKTLTLLLLAVAIAAPVVAQDKKKKKKGNRGRSPVAGLIQKVKAAGADEATMAKVEALAKEYGPKLAEARKGLGDAGKKMAEARKQAAADGKKGRELQEAVLAAANLSPEQKKAFEASRKLQQQFTAAVREALGPELAKKAGIGGRGGKKKKNKS